MPDTAEQTYTISELAKEFDVTTRTIRFYEDKGILSPQREGQKRIYVQKDRVLLKLTLRGKRLGFTLAESQKIFDMYEHGGDNKEQLLSLLTTLDEKEELLAQKRRDIAAMDEELKATRQRCETALQTINENN